MLRRMRNVPVLVIPAGKYRDPDRMKSTAGIVDSVTWISFSYYCGVDRAGKTVPADTVELQVLNRHCGSSIAINFLPALARLVVLLTTQSIVVISTT